LHLEAAAVPNRNSHPPLYYKALPTPSSFLVALGLGLGEKIGEKEMGFLDG